jgi:8-oxo-dGTP pyrophosphatase MutT (NUDIX family)
VESQPGPLPRPPSSHSGETRGPWRVTSTRQVYKNPWIRLREDEVVRPDGKEGIYGVVEFEPAVAIVALTDDRQIHMVGQFRYPTQSYSWEVIEGYAHAGESPEDAAARELREETGLTASEWLPLGHIEISNSVTDQIGFMFLARGLTSGQNSPDPTEELSLRLVPFEEALAAALDGRTFDAFSICALTRAQAYLSRAVQTESTD